MFELRIWGGFAKQRKNCVEQKEFAVPVLSKELEAQVNQSRDSARASGGTSGDAARDPMGWLWIARQAKNLVARSACFSFGSALSLLCSVVCTEKLLARPGSALAFVELCVGFVFFQMLNLLFSYQSDLLRAQVQSTVHLALLNRVNLKLLKRDPHRASGFSIGTLKTLVSSDLKEISGFVDAFLFNGMPFLVSALVLVPAIVLSIGAAGVWGIGAALLQIPFSIVFGKFIEYFHASVQKRRDANSSLLGEWIRNIRLIRSLSWQHVFVREIELNVRRVVKAGAWEHLFTCFIVGFSFCWWMLPIAALVLSALFLESSASLPTLFASVWLLNHLSAGLQHIPFTITKYAAASACLKRVVEVLQTPDLPYLPPSPANEKCEIFGKAVGIELQNVSVHYADKKVLSNLSLKIDFSQKTAVVGSVGAGKTTLLRVFLGDLRPSEGQVLVEFERGHKANLWEEKVAKYYHSQIGSVPQEPFLSNTTFANNISLETGTGAEDVAHAVELAELEADVRALERGSQEEVGEVGVNLSGGQKQRVSIARAFYSGRTFLFLDDPLSAVDSKTENALMNSFLSRLGGFVMVSHRLGELSRVNRILVLENGRVLEDAPPEVLLAHASSRYREFLEI